MFSAQSWLSEPWDEDAQVGAEGRIERRKRDLAASAQQRPQKSEEKRERSTFVVVAPPPSIAPSFPERPPETEEPAHG